MDDLSITLRGAGRGWLARQRTRARFLLFSQTFLVHQLCDLGYRQLQLECLEYIEGKVFRFGTERQQLGSSRYAQQMRGKHIKKFEIRTPRTEKWHNGCGARLPWPQVQCDLATLENNTETSAERDAGRRASGHKRGFRKTPVNLNFLERKTKTHSLAKNSHSFIFERLKALDHYNNLRKQYAKSLKPFQRFETTTPRDFEHRKKEALKYPGRFNCLDHSNFHLQYLSNHPQITQSN